MKLVVGLGNPTARYERTRHNVGFRAAELFARIHGIDLSEKKWNAVLGTGVVRGEKVAVVLPQTYMNLSGESVGPAARFWKVPPEDVFVLHDELDLPLGRLMLKQGGGHAGHNGLKSLARHLGSPDFVRLRIGISRPPPKWETSAYVLAPFTGAEEKELEDVLDRTVAALDLLLDSGLVSAMNEVNKRQPAR